MREIKFRAWDKVERVMRHQILLPIRADINYQLNIAEEVGLILMQYTGLKDKNGKESYLSDICKLKDHTDIYEIKWCKISARFYFYGTNSGEERSMNYEFKIIGNIYENPELYGGKK